MSGNGVAPTVVCSVLESDPSVAARRVAAAPAGCSLVEIRADSLRAAEVETIVRGAGRPTIVTVRSVRDGGAFDGSEEERRAILAGALRAGAAFVDVEWDGPQAELASGADAERVILSHHGAPCEEGALHEILRGMLATKAARLKLVPRAAALTDAAAVRAVLREAQRLHRPLAAFALGPAGVPTRLLALCWGSWATYGSAAPGRETAEGQLPAAALLDPFDVLRIGPATRLFGLAGSPVTASPSPALHAAGYREQGLDARYLLLPTASIDDALAAIDPSGPLAIEGLGITIPLKEAAAARVEPADPCARAARSVNTVVAAPGGPRGYNTDGPAALACIRRRLDPAGLRVVVAGAGGTARAIGWSLLRAGAEVSFHNRSGARAAVAAAEIGGMAGSWEELRSAPWDLFVQATPLGRDGEEVLPRSSLRGRLVLDAAYAPRPTPLVEEARALGIATVTGLELLVEQALLQFAWMTGCDARRETLETAAASWRASRAALTRGADQRM